jgi:hypothetical protein
VEKTVAVVAPLNDPIMKARLERTAEWMLQNLHNAQLHDTLCIDLKVEWYDEYGNDLNALGERLASRDDLLAEADIVNALPLTTVKFHQLQILRGTEMERQYQDETFRKTLLQFSLDEYIALVCDLLERLRPDLVVERLAGEVPPRYQACPERSFRRADGRLLRNEEIPALVEAELSRRDTFQGSRYNPSSNNQTITI